MQNSQLTDAQQARSRDHAVREGTSGAFMAGAGETYFTAYALFVQATTAQIAFLAAIPGLLGSFTQLVSAWLGLRTARRKHIVLAGIGTQALMWLPMIWLPYFFPEWAAEILLASVVVYYAAGNIGSPMWNSLLGDLVPEDQRGRYFARRSRYMNLASFVALAGAGLILHYYKMHGQPQVGFLMVFTVAAVARIYSVYQIARIHEPVHEHTDEHARSLRKAVKGLKGSNFLRFSVFMSIMNLSANIAGPFFAVYMLRDLGFSYLEFMASTAIVVLAQFFTLSMWGRIADSVGNRAVIAVTSFLIAALPALWLFSTSFWFIMGIQVLGGLAWAGFHLSTGNFLFDTVVPARRTVYGAMHNVAGAVAVFIGAAIGGLLSSHLPAQVTLAGTHIDFASGLCWLFLLSSVARLATAIYFVPMLQEPRAVTAVSTATLFLRIPGLAMLVNLFARQRP